MKATLTTKTRKSPIAFLMGSFGLCILLIAQTRSNSRDAKGLNASKRFACTVYGPKRTEFTKQTNSVNWFKNNKRDQSIGLLLVTAVVRLVVHDALPQLVTLSILSNSRVHLHSGFAPRLHRDFRVRL